MRVVSTFLMRAVLRITCTDCCGCIVVDRDDWLDDLPPAWPVETEMDNGHEVEIDKTKLDE